MSTWWKSVLFDLILALVPLGFFWQCYRTCRGCTIYYDTFFTSEEFDPTAWVTTGAPTIDLTFPGWAVLEAGDAIRCLYTADTGDEAIKVTILLRVRGGEQGSGTGTAEFGVIRIKIAWEDANNFLYVDYDAFNGTAQLGSMLGGFNYTLTDVETLVCETAIGSGGSGSGSRLDDYRRIEICFERGGVTTPYSGIAFSYPSYYELSNESNWESSTPPNMLGEYDDTTADINLFDGQTESFVVGGFALDSVPVGATIDSVVYVARGKWQFLAGLDDVILADFAIGEAGFGPGEQLADPFPDLFFMTPVFFQTLGGTASNSIMTWQHARGGLLVLSGTFGVAAGESQVFLLDGFGLELEWTSSSRSRGIFEVSFFGAVDPDSQVGCETYCLKTQNAFSSGGRFVEIECISGAFKIDSFQLEFAQSLAKPTCPECTNCRTGEPPSQGVCCCPNKDELAGSVLLSDFTGAFTNFGGGTQPCENCSNVTGGYILDGVQGINKCLYWYQEPFICRSVPEVKGLLDLSAWLENIQGEEGLICVWKATLLFAPGGLSDSGTIVQDPADPDNNVTNGWGAHGGHIAYYQSDEVTDCGQFPVQLNKTGDNDSAGVSGEGCNGQFPDVITLENGD
jgi:hypothetical protein